LSMGPMELVRTVKHGPHGVGEDVTVEHGPHGVGENR
jgi:hypothetical protein